MDRAELMKLGFLMDAPFERRHVNTEAQQLMIDVEWFDFTAGELEQMHGSDWKERYIEACKAQGVEPYAV